MFQGFICNNFGQDGSGSALAGSSKPSLEFPQKGRFEPANPARFVPLFLRDLNFSSPPLEPVNSDGFAGDLGLLVFVHLQKLQSKPTSQARRPMSV